MNILAKALEANLNDLYELLLLGDSLNDFEKDYLNGLYQYLRKDSKELKRSILKTNSKPISLMLEIRYAIAEFNVETEKLAQLEANLDKGILKEELWKAEALFILGMAWSEIKQYEKSKKFYQMGYAYFWKQGLKKKAVKSLFNIVVSESRLNDNKKLIVDYGIIAKKAIKVDDPIITGVCYHNISQRFRDMGAHESALKYANQAIQSLDLDEGMNHYYFAILNRCHIYLDMGRLAEAKLDMQKAQASGMKEIDETIKVLEKKMGQSVSIDLKVLDPQWSHRLDGLNTKKVKFTKSEESLIALLQKGPQAKDQLITKLYGDKMDYSSSENRLKVLLSRVRKKKKGLIILSDNGYEIADKLFLPQIMAEVQQYTA